MLERCTTARCAVLHGGRLAEKYGFFSTLEVDDSGEALTITDGRETWVFHILADDTGKGAVWAAQKLQPNHFAVVANMFVSNANMSGSGRMNAEVCHADFP